MILKFVFIEDYVTPTTKWEERGREGDDEIQAGLQGYEFLKVKDFCGSTVLFPASRYLKAKPVLYSSLHDKARHRGNLQLYHQTPSLVLTSFCLMPKKRKIDGRKR